MNPAKSKALANSLKRPLTTSKRNPFQIVRKSETGEVLVRPRMSAITRDPKTLRKSGLPSHVAVQDAKTYYGTGKQDARATAADMLRRYRKTGELAADLKEIVEFAKMDLGESSEKHYAGCCGVPSDAPKKWYPTLYVSGKKKIDLPIKGTATVEYRVRSKTTRQDENGETTESADIEIQTIDPVVEEAKPTKPGAAKVTKTDFAADLREVLDFARGGTFEKGGYVYRIPAGVEEGTALVPVGKAKGVKAHLKRNQGLYAGGLLAGGAVLASRLARGR